jgi:hypothetical protein
VIAPDGTVQVTRVVPLPSTISAAARENLVKMKPVAQSHQTLQEHRTETDKWQAERTQESLELYPAKLATDVIAGVPVRVVTPPEIAAEKAARVLINLHGGGFRVDPGSLSETIPIANLTGTKVISILYRLTPENRFPAASGIERSGSANGHIFRSPSWKIRNGARPCGNARRVRDALLSRIRSVLAGKIPRIGTPSRAAVSLAPV